MNYRKTADEIFDWAVKMRGRDPDFAWEGHSRVAAETASTIAAHCGMNTDKAYACGLLHDVGRYKKGNQMGHATEGYRLLKERMLEIAPICLTHSFYSREWVDHQAEWMAMSAEDRELAQDFLDGHQDDDYDKLIQLVDNMALKNGVTSLNDRLCHIVLRYRQEDVADMLIGLYELKDYFDKKCGMNIYELFKDDIIETVIMGLDGLLEAEGKTIDHFKPERTRVEGVK